MTGQKPRFARRLGFEGFCLQKVSKTRMKLRIQEGLPPIGARPAPSCPHAGTPFRQIEALGEPLKVKDKQLYNRTVYTRDDGKREACGAIDR